MRFLKSYKSAYVLVHIRNFVVAFFNLHHRLNVQVSEHRVALAINALAIGINVLSWLGYRRGIGVAYICERVLSIGRIVVALFFASAILVPFVILAPTVEILAPSHEREPGVVERIG